MGKKLAVLALLLVVCMSAVALAQKDQKEERYQQPGPVSLDREGELWAEKTLSQLSLEEKIGQMFLIAARTESFSPQAPEYLRLREALRRYHLGGFGITVWAQQGGTLIKGSPYAAAELINQLQRDSAVPLLIAADFEQGLAMRLSGGTGFPQAMAFGAAGKTAYAEQFGRITALEARALGVRWNWFPVADVNVNPNNPIINIRAFGDDPRQVGEMVSAYIRGAHAGGMLTTAKHFPGHGDTDADSHLGPTSVPGDRRRLETEELPPFQAAINAGADAVLVTHLSAPALDADPTHVATNSPYIVQEVLKKQLGFKGLVVADAINMKGLLRLYTAGGGNPSARAAVAAVKAGNDILLMPADLDAAYNGVLQAVRSGEVSQARIDDSVLKLLRAKASVGLHRARLVDLTALLKAIDSPEDQAVAQRVAEAAVTLIRDNGKSLPLTADAHTPAKPNQLVAVLFSDDPYGEAGHMFARQLRSRVRDVNLFEVNQTAAFSTTAVLAAVGQAERVIVAVYAVPQGGKKVLVDGEWKNTLALPESQAALLRSILERAAARTVVVAMGNPYLIGSYPRIETYLCTFASVPVAETSAIKALFGEIPITGRLPVDLPGVARRGGGLNRAMAAPVSPTKN